MTSEEVHELKEDILAILRQDVSEYGFSLHDHRLPDSGALYERVYEDIKAMLEDTLTGQVIECGARAFLRRAKIDCKDANVQFFICYDKDECFVVDISPFYLQEMRDYDDEYIIHELIRIDNLDRRILEKILEHGEC